MSISSPLAVKNFYSVPVSKGIVSAIFSLTLSVWKTVVNNNYISCLSAPFGAVVGGVFSHAAIELADRFLNRRTDQYDMAILAKMFEEDCGGVSKMPERVSACYKQYANKAVWSQARALHNSGEYLHRRYLECFKNVKPQECNGDDVLSWSTK